MDISLKTITKAKGRSSSQTGTSTREIGSVTRNKVTEYTSTQTVLSTPDSGTKIKKMAMVATTGQTDRGTKESISKANNTARDPSSSQTVKSNCLSMRVNGSKVSNAEKVTKSTRAKEEKANGRMVTSRSGSMTPTQKKK